MPRFFVDTRIGDVLHRDDEGEDFEDAASAIFVVKLVAAEFAADKVAHGHCILDEEKVIRNDRDEIVGRFMLVDALSCAIPRLH